jgi:hypothetical protein
MLHATLNLGVKEFWNIKSIFHVTKVTIHKLLLAGNSWCE